MTYEETLQFMYAQLPMFQRIGNAAFKKGLDNTLALCEYLGNPHIGLRCLHVAGTNGKGSTSHTLAAILQAAGYKVGLYTSPHLKSFTERIKINGEEIPQEEVIAFVEATKPAIASIQPSFFELTVGMAFQYFKKMDVDYAVIEVGLGGRLDSTNVISPELCVITNISYDHQDILGETLPEIASEKAGIIKPGVPVVISQRQEEIAYVFEQKAAECQAPIKFAEASFSIEKAGSGIFAVKKEGQPYLGSLHLALKGRHQQQNVLGIVQAADWLGIAPAHIQQGIEQVTTLTGLKGRWQQLGENPWVFCDVGHNEDGIRVVLEQLAQYPYRQLHLVWGMASDKKREKIWKMLPNNAIFYFCKANVPRGLDAEKLKEEALAFGFHGAAYATVAQAIDAAKHAAGPQDLIFIGGSTFVVAEIPEI